MERRIRVALSLVLLEMLLNVFSISFVANLFPNIPSTAHAALAERPSAVTDIFIVY
jgi:hypothetical protein